MTVAAQDRGGHGRRGGAAHRRQGLRRRRAHHQPPRSRTCPSTAASSANLAALVPGVSLGFHTDPTKSTQFAPQVAGGGGRNINYLIDGGDNNDDTVGGLVQNFPLDSIGEFNFETQRFRADTGRANGGTIKVVTKSGTNELPRLGLRALPRQEPERQEPHGRSQRTADKGDYRKHQFGAQPGRARSSRTRPTSSRPSSASSRTRRRSVNTHGPLPGQGRRLRAALPREHGRGQADPPAQPRPLPVRALRLQQQQPALRRQPALAARELGPSARTRSTPRTRT